MTENPYESDTAMSFARQTRATRWLIWPGLGAIALAAACVVIIVLRLVLAFNSSASSSATDLSEAISVAILPSIAGIPLGVLGIVLLIAGFVIRQPLRTLTPPAVKPPSSAPEMARFATASAILTGISLLVAVVVVLMLIAAGSVEPLPNQARYMTAHLLMLGALGFAVVSVPAFLGMILGAKALGEIRRSGGRKAGRGSAMFAVLAWLVLLPIAMAGILIYLLLPDGSGPNDAMGPGRNNRFEEPASVTSGDSVSAESDQSGWPKWTGLRRDSESPDASRASSPDDPAERRGDHKLT